MTFSFPGDFVDEFRKKFKSSNKNESMSDYILNLVKKDWRENEKDELDEFFANLNSLVEKNVKSMKGKGVRSSLEILREIRHNGKY